MQEIALASQPPTQWAAGTARRGSIRKQLSGSKVAPLDQVRAAQQHAPVPSLRLKPDTALPD
jgi:hypothetical protein